MFSIRNIKPKSFQFCRKRFSSKQASTANVFDRNSKRLQRGRAALADDSRDYDYLKIEIADRLSDRLLVNTLMYNCVSVTFLTFTTILIT
jgi:hypothetical protein